MAEFSSDSSSVADFLSLEDSSICDYETETCDSLIAGFDQCRVAEKKIVTSQQASPQENFKLTDLSSQSLSNNNVESSQGTFLSTNHTDRKITCEVGVNTDRSFNYKVINFRKPYFMFKKHLTQYRNFKRICNRYNDISTRQQKSMKKYRNYTKSHDFHSRWQFQKPEGQEDRAVRGFYFFTQMMKCFNQRF